MKMPTTLNSENSGNPLHALARALGVEARGDGGPCAVCGESPFETACTMKALGNMFNRWSRLASPGVNAICEGCKYATGGHSSRKPRPVRMTSFVIECGKFNVLQQADWWELLNKRPDKPFVASWATSRKKQHMLHAGWSGDGIWRIGADERCIVFEHREDVMAAVVALRDIGARKGHIASGHYPPKLLTAHRKTIETAELALAEFRQKSMALDLIVYALPVDYDNKTMADRETSMPLPPSDHTAIELLADIAFGSSFRVDQGIRFWGGYFESRIKRFSRLPLPDALSNLMGEVGTGVTSAGAVSKRLAAMDTAEMNAVSESIRARTTLLHALAFEQMKEKRGTK